MTMIETDAAAPEQEPGAEHALKLLKSTRLPGMDKDIVSAGLVNTIEVSKSSVEITLSSDAKSRGFQGKLEARLQESLEAADIFSEVKIRCSESPASDQGADDNMHSLYRADLAPDAGYGPDGPAALDGPSVSAEYKGKIDVFQWEIDPQDTNAKSDTAELMLGARDYRMWWQEHASGLIYTSIQAMRNDENDQDGKARSHPVGRMEAVNLVYDKDRKAIVAIYGTVRDFRPFVDAFYQSYVLKNPNS